MKIKKLGVNIDHVATIRNARDEIYPSPVKAAILAQKSGADSITIHLREDRRHIRDNDLKAIRRKLKIPKNSNVLIVEDVITTGKSALECSELVKQLDSKVIGYSCIIDRSNDNSLIKQKIISQIKLKMKIFKKDDLPDELKKIDAIKPGSRNLTK